MSKGKFRPVPQTGNARRIGYDIDENLKLTRKKPFSNYWLWFIGVGLYIAVANLGGKSTTGPSGAEFEAISKAKSKPACHYHQETRNRTC